MTAPARIIVVTGTDTDVGKTVATAALAAVLAATGCRVAIDKPTQTGVLTASEGDAAEVRRLTGRRLPVSTGVRLDAPMAPVAAAQREGRTLPTLDDHVRRITALAELHDVVLVEGAGGVLVELTSHGNTIATLAAHLRAEVVVVTRPDLGTLNHTALTLEALQHRDVPASGIIIGSWPAEPTEIHDSNAAALAAMTAPLWGRVRAGASTLSPADFCAGAQRWLSVPAAPAHAAN